MYVLLSSLGRVSSEVLVSVVATHAHGSTTMSCGGVPMLAGMPLISVSGKSGSTTLNVTGRATGAAVLHRAARARPTQRPRRMLNIAALWTGVKRH